MERRADVGLSASDPVCFLHALCSMAISFANLSACVAASAPRRLRGAWAQRLLLALLAILLALSTPHQLAAQDERVTVRLDGRALFRVGPTTDADAATRARRVERRLATLLENPQAIVPARVEPGASEGEQIVTVAGVPVVTVTVADAEDNVTTPAALAALWAQRIDTALVEGRARRLAPGGRFAAEVQSAVTAAFARLGESALTIVPRALAALLVLGLFWLLASLVRRLLRFVFKRLIADLTVENLIRQLTYYAIWALGLLVAVDALGFDPQTVVTGLGLTGLALGFALKDIISNFVSGLLILGLRPFQIGDQIVVGETEGSVERIELRATQIRTYDGRVVLVPNAEVFTSRVTNNTASPVRRGRVTIFLGYDVDLPRAMQIARDAAQEAEGVLETPPVSAVVSTLGQDDVVVEVRFWSDSRRSDVVATTSAVQLTVVAALRAAGITLPDPDVRLVKLRGSAA